MYFSRPSFHGVCERAGRGRGGISCHWSYQTTTTQTHPQVSTKPPPPPPTPLNYLNPHLLVGPDPICENIPPLASSLIYIILPPPSPERYCILIMAWIRARTSISSFALQGRLISSWEMNAKSCSNTWHNPGRVRCRINVPKRARTCWILMILPVVFLTIYPIFLVVCWQHKVSSWSQGNFDSHTFLWSTYLHRLNRVLHNNSTSRTGHRAMKEVVCASLWIVIRS